VADAAQAFTAEHCQPPSAAERNQIAKEVKRPGFHAPSGFCEPAGWSVTVWA
jgi:hypothetical protein